MLRTIAICVAALTLSGCGGGGKAVIIDTCMEEGDSKEDCVCLAQVLEENLSPRAFEAMVLQAQGKDEEAEKVTDSLGMTEALSIASAMIEVMSECGVSGFGR